MKPGNNPVLWKSKYGSVIASAYDICSTDGMNERGLVANLLWLAESSYPKWSGTKPGLTIAAWVQYVLDNYATVSEAVDDLSQEKFEVVSSLMPDGSRFATLHLAISDATGDSAIFEYLGGKLTVHHDRSYQVMTNSPVFDQQLALNEYWKNIGGTTFLPGTNRAADRFVRASSLRERRSRKPTTSESPPQAYSALSVTLPSPMVSARLTSRTFHRLAGGRSPTRKT